MMTVKPMAVLALQVLALLVAFAAPVPSYAASGADKQVKEPQTTVSVPIPEIVNQAEEVTKLLRDLDELTVPRPEVDAIQAQLPEESARLGPELESTIETIKHVPPLMILERMRPFLQASRLKLVGWKEVLTKWATQLEKGLDQSTAVSARWTQTRTDALASSAPAVVIQRVDDVLADIEATRARLQAQRTATLVLQDRVGKEVARCDDALDRIARSRQEVVLQTFARSTLPIWSHVLRHREIEELPARIRESLVAIVALFRQFIELHTTRVLLHGLLLIGLVLLAHAARRWVQGQAEAGEGTLPEATLFDRPYSAALVTAIPMGFWMYPDRPQTVAALVWVLLLAPLLRIVQPRVSPALVPALYGFAALMLTDRVRAEFSVVPLADQALLLLEMLAGMAGLAWLLGSGRLRRAFTGKPISPERLRALQVVAGFAMAVCVTSFAAAAYGTMRLARVLGVGLIFSAFLAILAYAAVLVIDGLLAFAFRVWPLRSLGMVERHRDLLERRAHRLLCWIMVFAWAAATLRLVGLLQSVVALGRAALAAELRQGTIGISLGTVIAFVITVWSAYLVSSLIRFVLKEDVYPRLHLAQGPAYVISILLHYMILLLGFVLAVAALGVDLNKVTVLAGAFGVGLGFGLQSVVNNFVSGLILLVERPIHVGDSILMSEVDGEVQRIGIRSTTVRTRQGADVIVPNAILVAEKVTNWTHSDYLRRMDVRVGVAYGSDPEQVMDLLRGVAASQPGVLAEPAPLALFQDFGDSALNFELRAWTDRFDKWFVIRSELKVALYAALRKAGMEIPFPQREVRLRQE